MTDTISFYGTLTVLTCWCGTKHAVPQELRDHQERLHLDGKSFDIYCPLGHAYVIAGKSKAQIEQERRERAEAREMALRDQLQASERSNAALRGVVTKAKKRAANGVCPCCSRTFANVARHVASQHPEYLEETK